MSGPHRLIRAFLRLLRKRLIIAFLPLILSSKQMIRVMVPSYRDFSKEILILLIEPTNALFLTTLMCSTLLISESGSNSVFERFSTGLTE